MNKKKSYTIFEVIISLIIFSIVLSSMQKLFIDNNTIPIYYELQNLENEFILTNKVHDTKDIKFQQH
jgi:hypothetical protein